MDIRKILSDASYDLIKEIWKKHNEWSKANGRFRGEPKWHDEEGTLNVMGIRCNTEVDFNYGKYNDYLILIYNKTDSFSKVILNVTCDPANNKNGIAHLRQGMWNSYVIRPHRWDSRTFPKIGYQNRWAICQDKHTVQIVRTDGKGKVISDERGMYGINIHDSGGYRDSSLGCTIIQSDTSYVDLFLPCIYDIKAKKKVPVNHDNITYSLINYSQLEKYIGTLIERVEKGSAVGGADQLIEVEAKKATRSV